MTDNPSSVRDFLNITLQRLEAKQGQVAAYSDLVAAGSLNFSAAVAVARNRLAEATTAVRAGPGAEFFDALYFWSTYLPKDYSDADLERLIEQAASDPKAYQVLRLIDHLSAQDARFPSLKRWRQEFYLGIFVPPAARPGVGHRKNAHRNALIIGEIQALVSVGFRPTRNESSAATSACDIVVEALKQSGKPLSYSAVTSIWNNRNKWPMFGSLLTDLVDAVTRRGL